MTNSLISVICVCDDCHDGLESRLTGLMDEVARLARFYEVLIIDNAGPTPSIGKRLRISVLCAK